jgi:hypothetical protein
MLRKLELDSLRADLASVESLLAERSEDDDPVGWLQFSQRKQELEAELAGFEALGDQASAGVAVFFGGRPVMGSRGVLASFGTKALNDFQLLVSAYSASLDGPVGKRGPVPQRDRSQMMITDVARGSIGFVLEEASENEELLETPLHQVVADVCDMIYRIGSPDEESFEELAATIDDRVLSTLKTFFSLLDESGATLRIVNEENDVALQRDDIELARRRTDALEVSEHATEIRGTFYVLPESKKFEIHPTDGSAAIRGTTSNLALQAILEAGNEVKQGLVGSIVLAELRVKEARMKDRPARQGFVLVGIKGG